MSQEGNWDGYLAQYDEGPGSTTLNMDLIKVAPKKEFPFLVITGVTFTACDEYGFPKEEAFDELGVISDNVLQLVSSVTKGEMVGSFTQQCVTLDYIYVRDTVNVRKKLEELYKTKHGGYEYYTNIMVDETWEIYLDFLYPNEDILDYMSNEKVLTQLSEAGDALTKPRKVDHWLYFGNSRDRDAFITFIKNEKFGIEDKNYIKDLDLPYQLHISRIDKIDLESINELTLHLRKKAKEYKGDYDGWNSVVVTD